MWGENRRPFYYSNDARASAAGRVRSESSPPRRCESSNQPCVHDRECLLTLYMSTCGKSWRTKVGWPPLGPVKSQPRASFQPAGQGGAMHPSTQSSNVRVSSPTVVGHRAPLPANPFRKTIAKNDSIRETKEEEEEEEEEEGTKVETAASNAGNPQPAVVSPNLFNETAANNNDSVKEEKGGEAAAAASPSPSEAKVDRNPFLCATAAMNGRSSPINPFADPATAINPSFPQTGLKQGPPSRFPPTETASTAVKLQRIHPPSQALIHAIRTPGVKPGKIRSALLDKPQNRISTAEPTGEPWFGVSLGADRRVTVLKLADNDLRGNLPNDLGGLELLRYLHIGCNSLSGPIPSSISNLVNLEWLNASQNDFSGIVPVGIAGLTQLVELNLSYNRLNGPLPTELCSMGSLVTLQLSHNNLEGQLPTEIANLSALVSLCLDHNRFSGHIPSGVSGMKALRELRLNHNALSGRIPLGTGKMNSLKILHLSHNLLRGSMPEGLISKLGATRVHDFVMPGNRLADVDTALLLLRRPLECNSDRLLMLFSLFVGYMDLGTDVGAAVMFYIVSDLLSFGLAVTFIVVPTCVMVTSTLGARGGGRRKKVLLTVFQLRLLWEARQGLKHKKETRDFKTTKFVEACFEAAPQMLLQTVALASAWNAKETDGSEAFIAFSILNSVFSLSWETMSALDRGWAEEMVAERSREGRSWVCGATAHRWLVLLLLWAFHVCEIGLRGTSLAVLALSLQGWAALVMLGAWGVRVVIAKATEASDLKITKVLIKALAACLLDSVWDSQQAYVAASFCTLVESSIFFVVAAVELRREATPLEEVLYETAWVAGSVYAVRCFLDMWLRTPMHWGQFGCGSRWGWRPAGN